nr:MAG TPA: protein of unknown function (DUF4969) [Caudoviricetes sp.]
MKKIFSVLLCVILLVTMAGCGGNSYTPPTYKNIDIENLPYSVPYYKNSTLDILSVEMYQAAGDLYGKYIFTPYVICKIDKTSIDQLSENDRFWVRDEVDISYSCHIDSEKHDLIFEDFPNVVIYDGDDGFRYVIFSLDPPKDSDGYFFEDFSDSKISFSVFRYMKEVGKEDDEMEREMYSYDLENPEVLDFMSLPEDVREEIVKTNNKSYR